MRCSWRSGTALAFFLLIASGCGGQEHVEADPWIEETHNSSNPPSGVSSVLAYEPNHGQTDPDVRFIARTRNATAFVTQSSLVFVAWEPEGADGSSGTVVRLEFEGAAPSSFELVNPTGTLSHYFLGNDPSRHVTNVPQYEQVIARGLFPGIDLVLRGDEFQDLRFDFVLEPGADPNAITMRVDSTEQPVLDSKGNIRIPAGSGFLVQRPPLVYQDLPSGRHRVEGRYLLDRRRAKFQLGDFDRTKPLVIDPSIGFAIVFPEEEEPDAVVVDASGSAYVSDHTSSLSFPVQDPLQETLAGDRDFVLTKVAPDGSSLLFSTYLGGSGYERYVADVAMTADALTISTDGGPVLVGQTESDDIPTVNAFQEEYRSLTTGNVYIARFTPSGDQIVFASYLGGTGSDDPRAVVVATSGDIYVVGSSGSDDFPTSGDACAFAEQCRGSFLARVSPSGSLSYSGMYGSEDTLVEDLAVDVAGSVYLTGFDLVEPESAFVTKLSSASTGGDVVFSVSLSADTEARRVVLDSTRSMLHVASRGGDDIFLTGLSLDDGSTIYRESLAELLGGASNETSGSVTSLTLDSAGLLLCTQGVGEPSANTSSIPGLERGSALIWELEFDFEPGDPLLLSRLTGLGGDVRCEVDIAGRIYLFAPLLEPDTPDDEPRIAWLVRLSDIDLANDQYLALEDTELTVAAPGVLENDVDAGYADLTQEPLHADAFSLSSDGSFSYTPARDFAGTDRFRYRILVGTSASGPATVTLTVVGVNDAPTAVADSFATGVDEMLVVAAPGVLENDFDSEGDSLTAVHLTDPIHGVLFGIEEDGSLAYQPNPGFAGVDTFTYLASDGGLFSLPGTISVTVGGDQPETSITSGPAATTNDLTPEFAFASDVSGSTFQCKLDGASFTACVSPIVLGPLSVASHRFEVRAASGGFFDTTPATSAFLVAPDTWITSAPDADSGNAFATFQFTSNHPSAAFQCSFDGDPYQSCGSPFTIDPVAAGSHTFAVRAIVDTFNTDPTPANYEWNTDLTPPSFVLVSPTNGVATASSTISVTVEASEPVVVTASNVFVVGTSLVMGQTTKSVSLQPGYNTFTTFVQDASGNSSVLTFALFRDSEAPRLTFHSPENDGATYYSPVDVLVSLSEDVTVVSSSPGFLPTGNLSGGERTLSLSLSSGLNAFTTTLQDAAGNQRVYSGDSAFHLTLSTTRPPAPVITSPMTGSTFDERIAAVSGTASGNATHVRVTASNSVLAVVTTAGTWSANVLLPEGPSRIRAIGLSVAGATSPEASVAISAGGTRRVRVDSGDAQVGPIDATLAQSLVAKVTNLAGTALSGVSVTFSIVTEPVAADGELTSGATVAKTVFATSDANGLASVQLTLASSAINGDGELQPTIVTATVPNLYGNAAVFWGQGLTYPAGGTSAAVYLTPLGVDCTTAPGLPVGTCPIGPAGTEVAGFAVAVRDLDYKLRPFATVDFKADPGLGTFAGGVSTISVAADASGIARSGSFTLATTITNANEDYVMLRPDDLAATAVQWHSIEAILPGLPPKWTIPAKFGAYAYAGPPHHIENARVGTTGAYPELPAADPLVARVEDQYGNPIANTAVTFSAVPTGDPLDPGALVFRGDPTASTASACDHVLPKRGDSCTVEALSAMTYTNGIVWSQMTLGKRASTNYQVAVSASGTTSLTFVRGTSALPSIPEGDPLDVLQVSSTPAGRFGIVGTENDDRHPITAAVWGITCDGLCGTTYSAVRQMNKVVTFVERTGLASFNPPSATTGTQTSITGGPAAVAFGEVATLLKPDLDSEPGTGTADVSTGPATFSLPLGWDLPVITVEVPYVTLDCALAPGIHQGHFCDGTPAPTSISCRQSTREAGVQTYIDLTNGETENNVLVIRVEQSPVSPTRGDLVTKFESTLIVTAGMAFQPRAGMAGFPGVYFPSPGDELVEYDSSAAVRDRWQIPFEPGLGGCVERIAKSFVRPAAPDTFEFPVRPSLEFELDGRSSDAFHLQLALPGGNRGQDGKRRGWADEITRLSNSASIGQYGANGVDDWVEMRAWKHYGRAISAGALPVPTQRDSFNQDPFLQQEASVAVGEPATVLGAVSAVLSDFRPPLQSSLPQDTLAATTPCFPFEAQGVVVYCPEPEEPSSTNWRIVPTVMFFEWDPAMRTDEPNVDEGSHTVMDWEIEWTPLNEFWQIAVHEARHAWQYSLLIRSAGAGSGSAQFLPSDISVVDDSAPNNWPDNNDDTDCLPEAAFLISGVSGVDIGSPGGSAYGLLDTAGRPVFTASGESLGTILGDSAYENSDLFDTPVFGCRTDAAKAMRERDAVRFSRAVQDLRRTGPP